MTARIFLKLIVAVMAVLAISLVAVDLMASRVARSTYVATMARELEEKCRMIATEDLRSPDQGRIHQLALAAGGRITVIDSSGRVIADSENDPSQMDNHLERPEVRTALEGGVGETRRRSPTMGVDFLYIAIKVPAGALRLAMPMSQIETQVDAIRGQMLAATALAFLPAVLIAALFARYASTKLGSIIEYAAQLAQGNFSARLTRLGPDELGVLSSKLNETGEKLQAMFQQLQEEQVELEKLERIRKDFVINVSHELRTPLASIQGYAETLLDGALHDEENNERFLTIIRQNAERLARLTADLLTLSRIEMRQTTFQFASYRVSSLLRDCVDSLQPLAQRKSVILRLIPPPNDLEVFCDSEAVHQILSNLIDNAIKYTPEEGSVTLSAQRSAAGSGPPMIEISVRDSGVGIPTEDIPRLFERFYRVDKARSRELGGTGLGLAIVKHLTLAQGGEVRVDSIINQGSTFTFALPENDLGYTEERPVQSELMVS
jgi:two-component system phosphate regulon sensor histidine kinase PhoR